MKKMDKNTFRAVNKVLMERSSTNVTNNTINNTNCVNKNRTALTFYPNNYVRIICRQIILSIFYDTTPVMGGIKCVVK